MKSNSRKVLKQQRDEEIAYATDTNYYSGVTSINLHRMFGQVSETGKRNYKSASLLLTIISEKRCPIPDSKDTHLGPACEWWIVKTASSVI